MKGLWLNKRMTRMQKIIDSALKELGVGTNILIAGFMGLVAHLDTCASVLAVLVLLFQLRASYYRSIRQKIELRECLKKRNVE